MKKHKIISMVMAAILLIVTASPGTTYATPNNGKVNSAETTNQDTAKVKNKKEVVYGKLKADGSINGLYVVNHFEVEEGGTVTDYGDYQSVQNLTESEEIKQTEDTLSLQVEEGDFYYQGNLKAHDLPWIVEITYDLDGKEILPQDLPGKSGELGIHISTRQNRMIDPVFFGNYMIQISVTLDSDKTSNISAPGAVIADGGNNTILTFTVMPKKNGDFQVKADVSNFTMSGIELSAMPFFMSVELPDTDGMLEDFNKLPEAISDLNDGVKKLSDGTNELKKGADGLKNGSGEFKDGLSELKKNSSQIKNGSSQINKALGTISSSLNTGSNGTEPGDLTQLPMALKELSQGLKGISQGLNELKNGYSTAYSALDTAIQTIPQDVITQDMIQTQFPDASEDQLQLLNRLYSSYSAGQTVKATYHQVQQAFASVLPAIENVTGNIDKISEAMDGILSKIESSSSGTDITAQAEQLSKGIMELANQYSKFDKGLNEYMNGVEKLSDGYNQFDSGVSEFADGVGNLNEGVLDLNDGTDRLKEETSKMPDKIQEEINKLTEEYKGSDFEEISFVSPKNINTGLVQFVLKCEGIEINEVKTTKGNDESKHDETVWDRFTALFKKD